MSSTATQGRAARRPEAAESGKYSPRTPRLTERQAQTVDRLAAAALDEVRDHGFEGLTVRSVARRAGVASGTAYTYFASKEHLVAEVFRRRLAALPDAQVDRRRSANARVGDALAGIAVLIADEPELAAAATPALLAPDPDVKRVRDQLGVEIRRRVARALGDDADPAVLRSLEMVVAGATLQAGMGHVDYADLPARLAEAAGLILGGRP